MSMNIFNTLWLIRNEKVDFIFILETRNFQVILVPSFPDFQNEGDVIYFLHIEISGQFPWLQNTASLKQDDRNQLAQKVVNLVYQNCLKFAQYVLH